MSGWPDRAGAGTCDGSGNSGVLCQLSGQQCSGAPSRFRPCDLLGFNQALYLLSYRCEIWRHIRDSNPWLLARQASTLAAELMWRRLSSGWGSRVRTWVVAFKARCPAVRRSPRWWARRGSNPRRPGKSRMLELLSYAPVRWESGWAVRMVRATGFEPADGGTPIITRRQRWLGKRASLATTRVAIRCIRNHVPSLITRAAFSAFPLFVLGLRLPFPLRPREQLLHSKQRWSVPPESNRDVLGHWVLNPARLPVPPGTDVLESGTPGRDSNLQQAALEIVPSVELPVEGESRPHPCSRLSQEA